MKYSAIAGAALLSASFLITVAGDAAAATMQCGASSVIRSWYLGKPEAQQIDNNLANLHTLMENNQGKYGANQFGGDQQRSDFFSLISRQRDDYLQSVRQAAYSVADPKCYVCQWVELYDMATKAAKNCADLMTLANQKFPNIYGQNQNQFYCDTIQNVQFSQPDLSNFDADYWTDIQGRQQTLKADLTRANPDEGQVLRDSEELGAHHLSRFTHTDDNGKLAGDVANVGPGKAISCR